MESIISVVLILIIAAFINRGWLFYVLNKKVNAPEEPINFTSFLKSDPFKANNFFIWYIKPKHKNQSIDYLRQKLNRATTFFFVLLFILVVMSIAPNLLQEYLFTGH
jgi:hypothetical protein